MPAACTGVGVDKASTSVGVDKAIPLPKPTPVQAAGMALRGRPTRDWKREFILHL